MTNNIPSNVYVYQFDNGDYLSWFQVSSHYSFARTSSITQATMFENAKEIPEWISNYLGGTLKHISLEVVDESITL